MLKFALVGCGRISKRHSELLGNGQIQGATLAAVCDVVPANAEAIAKTFGVPGYTDMHEMMRLAKIACCHCMLCTDVCPRYLLGHKLRPDKLMRLAAYNSTCEHDAAATEASNADV